jgi:hypothetical protein
MGELNDLKKHIFDKDASSIIKYKVEDSSFEEFFLQKFFSTYFQSESKNIQDKVFLSNFSKVITKEMFNDTRYFNDSSIFNLFPSCHTHESDINLDKFLETTLCCEKFKHRRRDLIRNRIFKRMNDFRKYLRWVEKIKKPIITFDLIGKIANSYPNTDSAMIDMSNNKVFLERFSNKKNLSYFNAINEIIKEAENRNYSKSLKYWERGRECENPDITNPGNNEDYQDYHFNDWMKHYRQVFLKKEDNTFNARGDFHHLMAGLINRYREIFHILDCRSCGKKMSPNWKYGVQSFGSYRVTVFKCDKSNCKVYNKGYYINHCVGCNKIIDSRDITKKCSNNRYVCDTCYACCKESSKDEHIGGTCPKCNSNQLVVFGGGSTTNVKCFNNCTFKISKEEIQNSRRLYRFLYLDYKVTSAAALENKSIERNRRYQTNR